jgi:predicted outer membrane lipoprotein
MMTPLLWQVLIIALFWIGAVFAADVAPVNSQIENNTIMIAVLGIFLTAALGVMTKMWFSARDDAKELKKQRDTERNESLAAQAKLHEDIAVLGARMEPVNVAFLRSLAAGITHAVHQITDDLVAKAVEGRMTLKEEQELDAALLEREANPGPFVSEVETDAVRMFRFALRRVNAQIALGYLKTPEPKKILSAPIVTKAEST